VDLGLEGLLDPAGDRLNAPDFELVGLLGVRNAAEVPATGEGVAAGLPVDSSGLLSPDCLLEVVRAETVDVPECFPPADKPFFTGSRIELYNPRIFSLSPGIRSIMQNSFSSSSLSVTRGSGSGIGSLLWCFLFFSGT
jgi:hypothetical protein